MAHSSRRRASWIALAGCAAAGCVEPKDEAPQTETCRTVAYAESRFGLASGPDRLEEWAFDARGDMRTNTEIDPESGGPKARWEYTWDEDHNVVSAARFGPDDEAWGTDRWTYAYNADGHVIVAELDTYDDGIVDRRSEFTRDADGHALTEARWYDYDADWGPDGTFDFVYRYAWSWRNGHMVASEADGDDDGVPDVRTRWARDAHGRVLSMSSLDNGVSYRTTWARADGRVHHVDFDVYIDGAVDGRDTWTYAGNTLVIAEDFEADGPPDAQTTWTFAEDGAVTRWEYDYGIDGVNQWKTWAYAGSCPTLP